MMKASQLGMQWLVLAALAGCSSLLPDAKRMVETPWHSYAEAEAMYGALLPGQTTLAQLQQLGVDPARTPNVVILSHADLLRRLQPLIAFEGKQLDPAIASCVAARQACFAYRIEQQWVERDRVGNFWLDFLNFKRETHVSGWQFDALVVVNQGMVVYKTWTGKPTIREVESERHPLGPLQGLGSSLR